MTSKQEAIISGEQIKNMLLGAYKSFEKNYQYINDLNVFPVPDGDTGTNMMHTMAAVAREISQLQNATVSEVGTMAARSAIMGARGNSGVILSQLEMHTRASARCALTMVSTQSAMRSRLGRE